MIVHNAIELHALGKRYFLYESTRSRFLMSFGLHKLPFVKVPRPDEFWALRDINLTVPVGQRLGIIGHNGAGKTTLLKLILGSIAPSEGSVRVNGKIQALMEIGTGFHPDFTGRENIRSSLGLQGVAASRIRELEEEVIAFSELEDFIDQPLSTYSAGMYARLAFSVSTCIQPELLVIDEILGAGDAHFNNKCLQRMKKLTSSGATVLFVSHDLSGVQGLCERVIWINRGKIVMDGSPLDVTKAYYAATVSQEAEEQKVKNDSKARRGLDAGVALKSLMGRIVMADGTSPKKTHYVKSLSLLEDENPVLQLDVGSPRDNNILTPIHLLTDPTKMIWSHPHRIDGKLVRQVTSTGGIFNHAPFVVIYPFTKEAGNFAFEIEHCVDEDEELAVEVYDGNSYRRIGILTPGKWTRDVFRIPSEVIESLMLPLEEEGKELSELSSAIEKDISPSTEKNDLQRKKDNVDRFSSNYASIDNVSFRSLGKEVALFSFGEDIAIKVDLTVLKMIPTCEFAIAIYLVNNTVVYSGTWRMGENIMKGSYSLEVVIESPPLHQGDYVFSFALIDGLPQHGVTDCFYAEWNRTHIVRIDENYVGDMPLGLVSLTSSPARREYVNLKSRK